MPNEQQHGGLELRILYFQIPSDVGAAIDQIPAQHGYNRLQQFLGQNGLWGPEFRYGYAASDCSTEKELMNEGFSAKSQQVVNDQLVLFTTDKFMELMRSGCGAAFFSGAKSVVVYRTHSPNPGVSGRYQFLLSHKGLGQYQLLSLEALVAIVAPTLPMPTHPGSSLQARASQ